MATHKAQSLKVMVLLDQRLLPPKNMPELSEQERLQYQTEYDVINALRKLGHEVRPLGVETDLSIIRQTLTEFRPDITFNLLEEFNGNPLFDQHVVSYLELLKQSYTGCNPRGLTLAHDKSLSKKILNYHRIATPSFVVYPIGHRVRKNARLIFPMIVKSLVEEGSVGISQASLVNDLKQLTERVRFMHEYHRTHVIAEQYIPGRELHVAVIGNNNLTCFPVWELSFKNLPKGAANIATDKAKWDFRYQEKVGFATGPAENLSKDLLNKINRTAKAIYKILNLSGYARLDFRLTEDGRLYLLEANPNPNISRSEDFPGAAKHAGMTYSELLQRIINLGLKYQPSSVLD